MARHLSSSERRLGLPRADLSSFRQHVVGMETEDDDSSVDEEDRILSERHGEAQEDSSSSKGNKKKPTDQEIADEYNTIPKKPRKQQPKLEPEHLVGPKGLMVIRQRFPNRFPKQKQQQRNGKSKSMALFSRQLIQAYEQWCDDLLPGVPLEEVLWKLRTMNSKATVKNYITTLRNQIRNEHVERIYGLEQGEALIRQLEMGLVAEQAADDDEDNELEDAPVPGEELLRQEEEDEEDGDPMAADLDPNNDPNTERVATGVAKNTKEPSLEPVPMDEKEAAKRLELDAGKEKDDDDGDDDDDSGVVVSARHAAATVTPTHSRQNVLDDSSDDEEELTFEDTPPTSTTTTITTTSKRTRAILEDSEDEEDDLDVVEAATKKPKPTEHTDPAAQNQGSKTEEAMVTNDGNDILDQQIIDTADKSHDDNDDDDVDDSVRNVPEENLYENIPGSDSDNNLAQEDSKEVEGFSFDEDDDMSATEEDGVNPSTEDATELESEERLERDTIQEENDNTDEKQQTEGSKVMNSQDSNSDEDRSTQSLDAPTIMATESQ